MCSPDKAQWICLFSGNTDCSRGLPLAHCGSVYFKGWEELWKQFLWIKFILEDGDDPWEPRIVLEGGVDKGTSGVTFLRGTSKAMVIHNLLCERTGPNSRWHIWVVLVTLYDTIESSLHFQNMHISSLPPQLILTTLIVNLFLGGAERSRLYLSSRVLGSF